MPSDSFDPLEKIENNTEFLILDKKQVLQKLIEKIKTKLEALVESRDKAREMAEDSPGANQSHSDTSKFQLSNVQLGLESLRIDTKRTIVQLEQMPINVSDKVRLGAMFTIHEISGESKDRTYFLVPAGGGEIITMGDINITAITPGTPIAKICLQKEDYDTVVFQDKEFKIINVS